MSALLETAAAAFARTTKHNEVDFVRVVQTPEDFSVIHHPGVVAAIWLRPMPEAVLSALYTLNAARFPENNGTVEQWLDAPCMRAGQPHAGDPRLPAALRDDMLEISGIFNKAVGEANETKLAAYTYRIKPPPKYHQALDFFQPHADSKTCFNMIVSYTRNPRLVMEWYPFLGQRSEDRLTRTLAQSNDPDSTKRGFDRQRDPPGSVMVFRGLKAGTPLIHNIPEPQQGDFRMAYMNKIMSI